MLAGEHEKVLAGVAGGASAAKGAMGSISGRFAARPIASAEKS